MGQRYGYILIQYVITFSITRERVTKNPTPLTNDFFRMHDTFRIIFICTHLILYFVLYHFGLMIVNEWSMRMNLCTRKCIC